LSPEHPEIRIENRFETAHGARWTLWTNRALSFDGEGRWAEAQSTGIDISDRRRAEEALKRSEERFRRMADSSPILIWMTDDSGRIQFLNRTCLDYCGIVAPQGDFDWMQIVHPEERAAFAGAYQSALQEPRTFYQRARLRRFDGTWRWFESRANPIVDETGSLIAFIGSSADISDIYESQQALRELGQRKDEFLANMSHEIRSPLTGIMGYADILLSRLKDPDDIECLRTIKESGDYLVEIVNDILDLSKIEAGKLVLTIEPVPIHSLLSEVQQLMAIRAKQKKLSLGLRYESSLPETVQTDRTRLRQILINLVSNGIKFTEQGRVDIIARIKGRTLELEVADTGIGIAPEHQAILFQPFTQADTSSTRQYGGTGLGLTITKRLVEMLGGEVSFTSSTGRGSTFRVSVPLGDGVAQAPAKRKLPALSVIQPTASVLRGKRVLVVDDREEICYLVSRYIREAGGRPEEATDGESALQAIANAGAAEPFDAVILDIHMPGMDGYEVVRALRARGFIRPVIALTAGAMVGDREKCLQAGFDDYLTKPIDRAKLIELVAQLSERGAASLNGASTGPRILLIDDSHNTCKFLTLFLEKRGYLVRSAHDGETALAAAADFQPGVVVMDIGLPDMDGFQLLRRLKTLDGVARARFIGLSGYRNVDEPGFQEFDHFLEKPVDTAHLHNLLREIAT
jgi:PAS domain S-box-containing protein